MLLVRVQSVEPPEKFRVRVTFKNGAQKEIDLEKFLRGEISRAIFAEVPVRKN